MGNNQELTIAYAAVVDVTVIGKLMTECQMISELISIVLPTYNKRGISVSREDL